MKRAGRYVNQSGGFKAFIPASLALSMPLIKIEGALQEHLEQATLFLARLDGDWVHVAHHRFVSFLEDPSLLPRE